jgi:hypothetical protein
VEGRQSEVSTHLGKFKNGKTSVYINKLSDAKVEVIKESIKFTLEKYPKP